MRRELTLILWVTSFLLLGFGLFHGKLSTGLNAGLEPSDVSTLEPSAKAPPSADETNGDERELPAVDRATRPLFDIAIPADIPSAPAVVTAVVRPVLKGIVSSDGRLVGIFALDSAGSQFQSAGEGDELAGFRLTQVSADGVTAVNGSGGITKFPLRGAGEGGQ